MPPPNFRRISLLPDGKILVAVPPSGSWKFAVIPQSLAFCTMPEHHALRVELQTSTMSPAAKPVEIPANCAMPSATILGEICGEDVKTRGDCTADIAGNGDGTPDNVGNGTPDNNGNAGADCVDCTAGTPESVGNPNCVVSGDIGCTVGNADIDGGEKMGGNAGADCVVTAEANGAA